MNHEAAAIRESALQEAADFVNSHYYCNHRGLVKKTGRGPRQHKGYSPLAAGILALKQKSVPEILPEGCAQLLQDFDILWPSKGLVRDEIRQSIIIAAWVKSHRQAFESDPPDNQRQRGMLEMLQTILGEI